MTLGYIPLNDSITVIKNNGLDEWGEPTAGIRTAYKARLNYSTNAKSMGGVKGTEVVSSLKVILSGLPEVTYEDTLEYTDKLGNVKEYKPVNISFIEDISGNVLYTVIEV